MAFIRRSGIAPLLDTLRSHCQSGRELRVLTTTYTGSTEGRALDALSELGADVRVSYDMSTTRLHAKAWLFHRRSGFSTAYIGSSNLTHSAQISGLEWNVRVSGARNPDVIDKVAAVFESYWNSGDFVPYDAETFAAETARSASGPVDLLESDRASARTVPGAPARADRAGAGAWAPSQPARLRNRHGQDGHGRDRLRAASRSPPALAAAVRGAPRRDPRTEPGDVSSRRCAITRSASCGSAGSARGSSTTSSLRSRASTRPVSDPSNPVTSTWSSSMNSITPPRRPIARFSSTSRPTELLGLTATPERSDGLPLLDWFDNRIAAELRLWDAIDQQRLSPFVYYGIHDGLDLRQVPWRRGRGYDVEGLSNLLTANDAWARHVLAQLVSRVDDPRRMRALGFCVSVEHARFMARVFREAGVASTAVWADSPDEERAGALADLAARRINVLFSVDLFNEGIDIPAVDTLLLLRPTDSPTLFLQQLGRGLRRLAGKDGLHGARLRRASSQGVPVRSAISGATRRKPQGSREADHRRLSVPAGRLSHRAGPRRDRACP